MAAPFVPTPVPDRQPTHCIGPASICGPYITPTPSPETTRNPRDEVIDFFISGPCNPGNDLFIDMWFWQNQVQWQPDSTVILFSQGPAVYAATVDGSRVQAVADASKTERTPWGPGVDEFEYGDVFSNVYGPMTSFDISPDGDRVVFATCAYRKDDLIKYRLKDEYELAVVGVDGSEVRRLTQDWGFSNYPSWSPDGTRIAYLTAKGGSMSVVRETRLWVMATDGSERRGLGARYPVVMHPPQWSPDGKRLAVVGVGPETDYYGGRRFLYTMRPDGTEWQLLGRTASGPSWSPDGTRLAFVAVDDVATVRDRRLVTMAATGRRCTRYRCRKAGSPDTSGDMLCWPN